MKLMVEEKLMIITFYLLYQIYHLLKGYFYQKWVIVEITEKYSIFETKNGGTDIIRTNFDNVSIYYMQTTKNKL